MPHHRNSHQIRNNDVHNRLVEELERLKKTFGLDPRFGVKWIPSADSPLSGEVKGLRILIYDIDEVEALETLRHEVIDFLVSGAIEPYRKITNELIKFHNKEAYRKKERVVDLLLQWVNWDAYDVKKRREGSNKVKMIFYCRIE